MYKFLQTVSHSETIICLTVPNDFSRIQKLAYEIQQIDKPFWVTEKTSEHYNYFSLESLCCLGNKKGLKKILAISDWPIDFFLLHKSTNYNKNNSVGHDCHIACTLLENNIYDESMDIAVNLFSALADAGIGREISVYFKLK